MRILSFRPSSTKKRCELPSVEATPLFFAVLALSCLFDKSGLFPCVLLAILLHELGHAAALRLFRMPISIIRFRSFGLELIADLPEGKRAVLVMLAGPCFNLLTAMLLRLSGLTFFTFGRNLFLCSLLLGVLHLLPVDGLDGGNALLCLTGKRASKVIRTFTLVLTVLCFAVGVFLLFSQKNPSLLILALWLWGNSFGQKKNSV